VPELEVLLAESQKAGRIEAETRASVAAAPREGAAEGGGAMRLAQDPVGAVFALVTQDRRSWLRPDALVAGGELDAAERCHIYAEMYRLRTRDALREDFPHAAQLLGAKWDQTGDAYVDAHHSDHPSLHRLGRVFAEFLRGRGRADLADLAALEWARSEAFVAEDSEVATPQSIATLGPERLPEAKVQVSKSLRLLELAT